MQNHKQSTENERLVTIRQAANTVGVHYRQLLQAVNEKLVPHYQLRRSRKLVKVSEVLAAMSGHQPQQTSTVCPSKGRAFK